MIYTFALFWAGGSKLPMQGKFGNVKKYAGGKFYMIFVHQQRNYLRIALKRQGGAG